VKVFLVSVMVSLSLNPLIYQVVVVGDDDSRCNLDVIFVMFLCAREEKLRAMVTSWWWWWF
jgi:uncharacterized protein YciU (UPF0263 family)